MKIRTLAIFSIFILASCLHTFGNNLTENNLQPAPTLATTSVNEEQSALQPTDKTEYKEMEKASNLLPCDEAQDSETGLNSIADNPILFGMCIAGYPNIDKLEPSLVQAFYVSRENIVVIVTQDGKWTPGDSVRSTEMRIDLVTKNKKWLIDWLGIRWKCKTGRGHQEWSPVLCS